MVDSIIKKGAFHRSMPQDYAVAEDIGTTENPLPFIAIADGCSAGRNSEIGAMILCRAALATANYFRDRLGPDNLDLGEQIHLMLFDEVKRRAEAAAGSLKLELNDMIATLKVAFISNNILYISESGDGFHFIVYNDGKFIMHQHEYDINAPYYLAYEFFNRIADYDSIGLNHLNDTAYTSVDAAHRTTVLPAHARIFQKIPLDNIPFVDYFGLATDGIASYMMEDGSGLAVKPEAIVNQLTQIKIPAGEFLVRRFQKMDRELESKGFINQDDVGVCMISLYTYRETLKPSPTENI